jgi:hypothetical protein
LKTLLLTSLIFYSAASMAAVPSEETVKVLNAVLNSPDVGPTLVENNSTILKDITIKNTEKGHSYVMKFENRPCLCIPSKATVIITEDLSDIPADGEPVYTSVISVE